MMGACTFAAAARVYPLAVRLLLPWKYNFLWCCENSLHWLFRDPLRELVPTDHLDAHLKPSLSLISPPILSLKLRIVTPRMHSSSIVCQHHDRAKFLVLSAPTVLARVLLSKFSPGSSSPISAAMMFVAPSHLYKRLPLIYLPGPSGLARDPEVFPWPRAAKLLHEGAGGQPEGTH